MEKSFKAPSESDVKRKQIISTLVDYGKQIELMSSIINSKYNNVNVSSNNSHEIEINKSVENLTQICEVFTDLIEEQRKIQEAQQTIFANNSNTVSTIYKNIQTINDNLNKTHKTENSLNDKFKTFENEILKKIESLLTEKIKTINNNNKQIELEKYISDISKLNEEKNNKDIEIEKLKNQNNLYKSDNLTTTNKLKEATNVVTTLEKELLNYGLNNNNSKNNKETEIQKYINDISKLNEEKNNKDIEIEKLKTQLSNNIIDSNKNISLEDNEFDIATTIDSIEIASNVDTTVDTNTEQNVETIFEPDINTNTSTNPETIVDVKNQSTETETSTETSTETETSTKTSTKTSTEMPTINDTGIKMKKTRKYKKL